MRLATLLLASHLIMLSQAGCQSTRVIEVGRNDLSSIEELNVDAARNRASVHRGSDPFAIDARESLLVFGDSVRFTPLYSGSLVVIPLSEVNEIQVSRSARSRGALVGFLGGAFLGAVAGAAFVEGVAGGIPCFGGPCDGPGGDLVAKGALAGAAGVGLLGALIGQLVGKRHTTIYRFRPDTPQQMSVVIGVGSTNGGAR